MKTILLLAVALVGGQSFGAFVSIDLQARFGYQGEDTSCVLTGILASEKVMLYGEVKGGKVVEATLVNTAGGDPIGHPTIPGWDFNQLIKFTPTEREGIEVKADAAGDYYVVTLPLSARLLNWIFFHLDILPWPMGCKPTKALATLGPNSTVYRFIQATGTEYTSPIQRFHGDKVDGTPYTIKMGFTQRQTNL